MTLPLLLVALVCHADAGVSAAEAKRAEQMVRAADAQAEADTKAVLAGTATPQQVARVRARAAAGESKAKQNAPSAAVAKQKAEDEDVATQRALAMPPVSPSDGG